MQRKSRPRRWLSPLLCLGAVASLIPIATAAPQISEFMASNASTLQDEDGDFSDWIEIHNPDGSAVQLTGYHLTDDAANLSKWTFPAVTLNAGARLIVFASNKDRVDPGGELHTSFRLSSGGEYLALIDPDGTTIVSEFGPNYPPQFEDESFGFGTPGASGQTNITPNWSSPNNYTNVKLNGAQSATEDGAAETLDAQLAGSQLQYYMWFDFSSQLGLLSPGDTINSATMTWSGSVSPTIFGATGVNSRLGIFTVPDGNHGIDTVASPFNNNSLINYYAANTPVSSYTAVPGQTPVTTWDITSLVQDWIDNPASPQRGQIMIINDAHPVFMDWDVDGGNKPTLEALVSTTSDPNAVAPWVYFDSPTPGAANTGGQRSGPIFGQLTDNPPQPVSGPLTIAAEIAGSVDPVASVTLYYRQGFGGESSTPMVDDGTGSDATSGDGIWTATIPGSSVSPGEMTRWRFVATDSGGVQTREPAFRDSVDSHEYFGTVGHDPAIESMLGVVHWFISNPSGANNTSGARGALYWLGEFYDNVHFSRHGQSTGGFVKKSYNIDFNKTQRFLWDPAALRVADIDLLTNWADKSKVRHALAWEIMRASGVHAHFAFTVRVEQNGQFFSTADFVEDADNNYLKRAGLNEDGALYKVYSNSLNKDNGDNANSGVEKKNRKFENNADLQALIDGLDLTGAARLNYLYDNIDIPKTVNMLAANSVIRNIDMHRKNWYIYRDTGKTDEWAILPWDLDLSGGRVWNSQNTYFDNALYTHGLVVTGTSIRLVSHMFGDPAIRSMLFRRIRTLSDTYLQEPGTPLSERWYERRLDEESARIDPPSIVPSDARRDFEKWGSWLQGNGSPVPYTNTNPDVETMEEALDRWRNEYLPGRRNEIYNNQTVGNGGEIPLPQTGASSFQYTPLVVSGAPSHALVPVDNSLGATWVGSPANEPFDTSGWISGTTGVGYERGSGYQSLVGTDVNTQMQSNNSVYVRVLFNVTDPSVFDTLELRMKWDDGFVAFLNGVVIASDNAPATVTWNSAAVDASHEASASSFDVYNISSSLGSLQAGQNVLAIHGLNQGTGSSDMIIMPELHGGVTIEGPAGEPQISFGAIEFSPASGNQQEEYIEFINPNGIAVDISDWTLEGGVDFTFQPGTVIPAGGSLYLSPDVNAFRARATSPTGGEGKFIQGAYSGHLSSFGETLTLRDSSGLVNNTASYTGNPSDPQLYLVITELMYHPAGDGLAEYIELMNTSDTVTLDLAGVHFDAGIIFDFTGSAVTSLAPGERVLVVRNLAAFTTAYGGGLPVAGEFQMMTALSNGGENIKLEDALNGTIQEFDYNDGGNWPVAADGLGYSVVLVNPQSNPDPDPGMNWRSSTLPGGNPGGTDVLSPPADPMADLDGNGNADIIDHALGNDLGLPEMEPELSFEDYDIGGQMETRLTLRYPISLGADTATVGIDESTDLETWADAAADTEAVSVNNLGDGRAMVTVRFMLPIGAGAAHYVRLRVETE